GIGDVLRQGTAPQSNENQNQIVKQALHTVFALEEQRVPALKVFIDSEANKPFQTALIDLRAGRNGGGLPGLQSWIGQAKDWYTRNTGIGDVLRQGTAPQSNENQNQIVKQALHTVFALEEQKVPALKVFLDNEANKPFQTALSDLRSGRNGGGLPGLQSWIGQAKDWYMHNTGINDFISRSPATLSNEKQIVKQALHAVFAGEEQKVPGLGAYLDSEANPPFQVGLTELRAGRNGGGLAGLQAWIQRGKSWYISNTGIGDIMAKNTLPTVLSLSQDGIPGDKIGIYGTGLDKTCKVAFYNRNGGFTSAAFEMRSADQILAIVPADAGTGPVAVYTDSAEVRSRTNFKVWSGACNDPNITRAIKELLRKTPRGEGSVGQCDPGQYGHYSSYADLSFKIRQRYGYEKGDPPRITGVSPASAQPGNTVTITGNNFVQVQAVIFGNMVAQYRPISAQQITATVPMGAGSGELIVSTLFGDARSSFGVKYPPRITSVMPKDNRLGNPAVVTGSNFQEVIAVKLDGRPVGFSTESSTQISTNIAWGIDNPQGQVEVTTQGGSDRKPLSTNSHPITLNRLGLQENCFGAVGNGCKGSGAELWGIGSEVLPTFPFGCWGEVANGQRKCWITPGSIKHDNCCVRHPGGKNCGGPGKDGKNAGEFNHDGNCVQEWDDAFWDVKNRRAWEAWLLESSPADLTPVASTRYSGGETKSTVNLCAPNGTAISARHNPAFCCAGFGKEYWAPTVEKWIVCGER
ncbi:MAG: IPT/TIG domain-containing protein, partial [Acidobacteria bacterium]|nr:IPT/TIG domain-containing protein [Acidobacteriota bacterium]